MPLLINVGYEPSWVNELDISDDLIFDYENRMEFANCKKSYQKRNQKNEILVQVSFFQRL